MSENKALPVGGGAAGAAGAKTEGGTLPQYGSALIAVVIVLALALAALMVYPSVQGGDVSSTPGATAPGATAPGTAVEATGEVTHIDVYVEGMRFVPAVLEVPAGNTLEVTLHNTGDQRHDLIFANGAHIESLAPGEQGSVSVGVIGANMDGWCTLPGHRQMGSVLEVVAVGADAGSGDGSGSGSADHGSDHSTDHNSGGHDHAVSNNLPGMDELIGVAQEIDPHPAELPLLTDETERRFTFVVSEDVEALADGVVRPVWTYNGTVPGPTLHGRVGDTFVITLRNEGTMGHSIDFHAGDIAPDEPMRTIEPGEELVYTFVANRSGIWMYHCGTMPMDLHIANGMFGAVVIEPDGLEEVDKQYVLIHHEVYVDEAGEANWASAPGSVDTSAATISDKLWALTPDLMAFNGRAFQYSAHPLTSGVDERVRIWVLNVGPNMPLSFHIVGTQFDTVWQEGHYSVHHGRSTDGITQGETGAQVISLLAAEGGFVEFAPHEAGNYTFVNHTMSLAQRGASGVLRVE